MIRSLMPALLAAALFLANHAEAAVLCTVVADAADGKVLHQQGDCETRVTPASTFKIPLSLMGFDAGFLKDEQKPELPYKKGYPSWVEAWKQPAGPSRWMKYSVLWYSQRIAEALGQERFARYVAEFDYGNRDVSGDPGEDNSLLRSWVSSSLRISPLEQAAFVRKLVRRELPVSEHAYAMTDRILESHALPGGWHVQGKTGAAAPRKPDGSLDREHFYGWYVGWAAGGDDTLIVVRLVQEERAQKGSPGNRARDAFLLELPGLITALGR